MSLDINIQYKFCLHENSVLCFVLAFCLWCCKNRIPINADEWLFLMFSMYLFFRTTFSGKYDESSCHCFGTASAQKSNNPPWAAIGPCLESIQQNRILDILELGQRSHYLWKLLLIHYVAFLICTDGLWLTVSKRTVKNKNLEKPDGK